MKNRRFATRQEFERAIYIKLVYILTPVELEALNNIEADYINMDRTEFCYFDTLRELLDKYHL